MGDAALGRKLWWLLAVEGLLTPGMGPPRRQPVEVGASLSRVPGLGEPPAGTVLGHQSASREGAPRLRPGWAQVPWEAAGDQGPFHKGVLIPPSALPLRCALLPTPLPHPPTSRTPSPCSPVSRLLRVSTVVAVAAPWPPRPHRPRHTSPMLPPPTSPHPAGQWRPRPQGDHSTTCHSSRPRGLRHPLPLCQTGRPWPPSRPLQKRGPTPPWRPRDKGGPSPLPEARTPWGGGEDVSMGPPHPPLSAPPFPGALEGRLDPRISTWAAPARSRKHGFGSESAGCWGAELQRPSCPPQKTPPRGPWRAATAAERLPHAAPRGTRAWIPTLGNAEPSPHACV